jgi:hypothetical protein
MIVNGFGEVGHVFTGLGRLTSAPLWFLLDYFSRLLFRCMSVFPVKRAFKDMLVLKSGVDPNNLLAENPNTAILVDSLDAFLPISDAERFLRRMKGTMTKLPQVFRLCSSHRHVHMDEIPEHQLYEHQEQSQEIKEDMIIFINEELAAFKIEQGSSSVFSK